MNANEIIGFRRCAGTSKKTGKPFSGYIVFFTFEATDTTGKSCDNAFISDDLLMGYVPEIGDRFQLYYNKSGFMTDFNVVS